MESSRRSPVEAEPFSRFEFLKQLGQGAFSEVWLVTERSTRRHFALKVVSKQRTVEQKSEAQVYTERLILQRQLCPEVVKLYSGFQDSRYLYYLMEYAEQRTLAHHLKKHGDSLSACQKQEIARRIVGLVERIHSEGVVHCDLKPENILIDAQSNLKLADFGCAKVIHLPGRNDDLFNKFVQIQSRFASPAHHRELSPASLDLCSQDGVAGEVCAKLIRVGCLPGTLNYLAPEAIKGHSLGFANDLWALGVIIGQLFAGQLLFSGSHELEVIEAIEKGGFSLGDSIPDPARDLVDRLLAVEPTHRLGCKSSNPETNFKELKAHDFFFVDFTAPQCGRHLQSCRGDLDLRRSSASLGGFRNQELVTKAELQKWFFFAEEVELRTEEKEVRVTRSSDGRLVQLFKLDCQMMARSPDSRTLSLKNGNRELTCRLREPVAEAWLERIRGAVAE